MYQFDLFPNEIIYCIFDYLESIDIVRIFSKLNQRYTDLVRIYIQKLDLTKGNWSKANQQELKWILSSINNLKIDQSHLYLLSNFDKSQTNITNSKTLWRSITNNLQICSRKSLTSDESLLTIAQLRFPHIETLKLVNVFQWSSVILKMNLKRLTLLFDKENHYFEKCQSIPLTIEDFSSNIMFDPNYFHGNLINLNIYVYSMVHLLEIIERTPKIQRLSIKFAEYFDEEYLNVENYQSIRFKSIIQTVNRLTDLIYLSFSTKNCRSQLTNQYFPFDQIRIFIDKYCPNETILKRILFKFSYIKFNKDYWSTIVRYKEIFNRFDCYISFIIEEIISLNTNFACHFEGIDFLHIYSLPFVFQTLYGFTNCSNLSKKCSYLSVRNLYFTRISQNEVISFEFLSKQMPNLIFIDFYSQTISSEISIENQIFSKIRHLNFLSNSPTFLPILLNQMPFLQILNTTESLFNNIKSPLISVKQLILQDYSSILLNNLCANVPHLTNLSLSHMRLSLYPFANIIGLLFSRLSELTVISLKITLEPQLFQAWYRKLVQPVLFQSGTNDSRLRNLKCTFKHDRIDFYLEEK